MKKFIIALCSFITTLCIITLTFTLVAPVDAIYMLAALSFVAFLALGYYKFKDR